MNQYHTGLVNRARMSMILHAPFLGPAAMVLRFHDNLFEPNLSVGVNGDVAYNPDWLDIASEEQVMQRLADGLVAVLKKRYIDGEKPLDEVRKWESEE